MLAKIEPHPEVPAALERLHAQYRVTVISTTDDDLISDTIAAVGTSVDFVVTA